MLHFITPLQLQQYDLHSLNPLQPPECQDIFSADKIYIYFHFPSHLTRQIYSKEVDTKHLRRPGDKSKKLAGQFNESESNSFKGSHKFKFVQLGSASCAT